MSEPPASPTRSLTQQQRRDAIAELVLEQQSVQAADLSIGFGVSLMTIHRDLDELAQQGLLRRFHGGATALRSSEFEPDVNYRLRMGNRAKNEIAAAALRLVEPDTSILLDDSTSALALSRLLPQKAPVTVITSFLSIIEELTSQPTINLIGIGGEYSHTNHSFRGAAFLAALSDLRVNLLFASSAAMSVDGVFHQEPDVVVRKKALMAAAAYKVLLLDHTKIGHQALNRVSSLDAWDAIIVDSRTTDEVAATLRAAGANLIVAEPLNSGC